MEDENFYKRIHSLDQATASFATIAAILGAYFQHLRKMNFSRKEAFNLVKIYQKNLLKLQFKMMSDMDLNQNNNDDGNNFKDENNQNGDDDEYFRN